MLSGIISHLNDVPSFEVLAPARGDSYTPARICVPGLDGVGAAANPCAILSPLGRRRLHEPPTARVFPAEAAALVRLAVGLIDRYASASQGRQTHRARPDGPRLAGDRALDRD